MSLIKEQQGNRSGQFQALHDQAIEEFVNNPKYEITPEGRIYSLKKSGRVEIGQIVKKKGRSPYVFIRVKKDGPKLAVHRIVYRKFKGPLASDLVVQHLDDNGLNNHIDNLALTTQSENNKTRFKHKPPVAGHRKITPEIADEVRALHAAGLSYRQILEITREKYGFGSKSSISYIINGKTWSKQTVLSPTPVDSTYNQKHTKSQKSSLTKSA